MLSIRNRLTKRADFSLIYKNGSYAACDGIAIKFLRTGNSTTRIGFSVGKNYSKKATVRNHAKRVLREAVKSHLATLKPGYDLVVMASPSKKTLEFKELVIVFEKLFLKTKLFAQPNSQIKK